MNYEVISKKRTVLLLLGVLTLLFFLILRVIFLQVFWAGWLKQSAEQQRFRALPISPRRGTIFDRSGNELAISIDGDCIYAIPAQIGLEVTLLDKKSAKIYKDEQTINEIAHTVGGILGKDPLEIKRIFSKKASFVWIKRTASYEEIEKLRNALIQTDQSQKIRKEIRGIEIGQRARRFYPQKFLAAQVLGIAGIDNQGLEGLEKQFDNYLRGTPGSDEAEFDTTGQHIPQGERRYVPPIDGDSLYLTIDQNIQYIVERELEKAVVDTNSKRGMALVVDPRNGDILAMASHPRYDPNDYAKYPSQNRRNPLLSDMYEPGSTFKVFTAAAALEEGKVGLDSTFFDPGFIVVEDRRIKCWKAGGHGSQTFVEAIENSCNPVFATLALRLSKETLYKYLRNFGFGQTSGIEFPGESAGILKPLSIVKNVELANIGFGQGITVSPLQMVMGVAAIANDGYLLKPHLVRKIVSHDGKVKQEYQKEVVRQVISPQVAKTMRELMQSVVTNGSGVRAYLDGYRVAGKTGTAQKVVQGQRGYSQLIASFIGFAPADDPRLVALVLLDEPNSPVKYGGVIAAPVVGSIFRDSLRYLAIKPVYEQKILDQISAEEVVVPNILNRPTAEALAILGRERIEYRLIGKGSYVYDQVPKPGIKINKKSKVLIYFDPEEKYQAGGSKVSLPNLQGLSLRKVDQMLTEIGLELDPQGTGVAVGQEPAPGTMINPGGKVRVYFKPDLSILP